MEIDPSKEVYFNVYGYTALVSGLKVNLRAVARDYSICFCVSREGLMEAMQNSKEDIEYFHEIRSRIEENACKEALEAPKIRNTREHYIPNQYFLLKR